MLFELVTLAGRQFSGQAAEVHLKLPGGEIGILPHHEPLTAVAPAGALQVHLPGGKTEAYAVHGGLLTVRDNVVRLLADEAEAAEELILHEIEAALAKAEQLRAAAGTRHELDHAHQLIDRHQVRLQVAHLRRHGRPGKSGS